MIAETNRKPSCRSPRHLGVAVAAVRQSIDDSSPITTAKEVASAGASAAASNSREVGRMAHSVRGEYDDVVRDFVLTQNPIAALPGRARDARRDRLQAADQPGRRRVDPSRECGFCRAHASVGRTHHRGIHR
jgi:hypothetical protein